MNMKKSATMHSVLKSLKKDVFRLSTSIKLEDLQGIANLFTFKELA